MAGQRDIKIRPLMVAELPDVRQLAREDGHGLIYPSHVILKNGQINGALSIDSMPIVWAWTHTQKFNAFDSIILQSKIDDYMVMKGRQSFFTLCATDSPYYPHMKKLTGNSMGNFDLFEKVL